MFAFLPAAGGLLLLMAGIGLQNAEPEPKRLEWKIDSAAREALVVEPTVKGDGPVPVVLGFHGHGGTMQATARKFAFHKLWPEALVVYPQGLLTPGKFDPDGKKPGWQRTKGDQMDRDLKFVDAMLATLKDKYRVDDKRIYATGHSNGGGFTYLLWAARPERFAAFAPSAAGSAALADGVQPRPVLHIAGEKDQTVLFENQQRTIENIKKLNGCGPEGKDWAEGCRLFASEKGATVTTFIHPGTHAYPDAAPPLIVRFFKENPGK